MDPEKAFTIDSTLGGGSVVTTNNFRKDLSSGSAEVAANKYHRVEQGTNFTINVTDYILDEEQHGAQAPIQ